MGVQDRALKLYSDKVIEPTGKLEKISDVLEEFQIYNTPHVLRK